MKYYLLILFCFSFLASCESRKKNNNFFNEDTYSKDVTIKNEGKIIKVHPIGVVSMNNEPQIESNDWLLLNLDNSIYAQFSPKKDEIIFKNGKVNFTTFESDYEHVNKYEFSPKLFYPELGDIVQFEYTKEVRDTFFVITNKKENILKKLVFSRNTFIVESWEEHLKKRALVGINNSKTPIYQSRNDKTPIYSNLDLSDVTFEVIQVFGEWIEIFCTDVCEPCQSEYKGWVRWKKGSELLIDLYYTC